MDRAQLLSGLRTGGPRSASFSNNMPLSASPSGAFPRQQQYDVDDASDMFHAMNLGGGANLSAQQQALFLQQLQAQQQMMAAGFGGNLSVNQAQAMQMQMELLRLQALQQQQNMQAQFILQSQLQVAQQQQQLNRRRSENHIMAIPATAGPTQSTFADSPISVQQTRMNAAATLRARAINRETSPTPPLVGSEEQQVPMSAALGGKFGSRGVAVASGGSPLNPHAAAFVGRFSPESMTANIAAGATDLPQTPTHTNVISGGTSLGGSLNNSGSSTPTTVAASYNGLSGYSNLTPVGPSKSDTALSWRRGSSTGPGTPTNSKPPSPPLGSRAVSSSPVVNLGPLGRLNTSNSGLSSIGSDSPGPSPLRARPQPLRFTTLPSNGAMAFSDRNSDNGDVVLTGDNASGSTKSGDSPVESSPPTSAGSGSAREREEASKRLYEGLGLGRPQQSPPASTTSFNLNSAAPVFKPQQPFPNRSQSLNTTITQIPTFSMTGPTPVTATGPSNGMAPRPFSVPIRQPRGPPSGVEELGARNFASRMRKKALGGLGALMDARAERENVAAGMEGGVGELGPEEVVAY